jgi:alcohol dehydrogenase (cytochrome c)
LVLAATALTATTHAQDAKSLAEPGKDWETFHGSYKSWNYSPLTQINADNVGKLKVAFIQQVGRSTRGLETTPLDTLLLGFLQQSIRREGRHR